MTPQITKYINFASVDINSRIFTPQLDEKAGIDSNPVLYCSKHTLKILTDIVTNKNFCATVQAIEADETIENILACMKYIDYFYMNLGPVVQNKPELASALIKHIIDQKGHANGHVLVSGEDGSMAMLPILAYALGKGQADMAAMLAAQADPLQAIVPTTVYVEGYGNVKDTILPSLIETHSNNVIVSIKADIKESTPILIYLMRHNFDLAEIFMISHKITDILNISEWCYDYNNKLSYGIHAIEVAVEAGKYNFVHVVEKFTSNEKNVYGRIPPHLIKTPQDIEVLHRKFGLDNLGSVNKYSEAHYLISSTPYIIWFMEAGKWDIVKAMLKPGASLNVHKFIMDLSLRTHLLYVSQLARSRNHMAIK